MSCDFVVKALVFLLQEKPLTRSLHKCFADGTSLHALNSLHHLLCKMYTQIRVLSPAEAAKEDGNVAFKKGDLNGALAAYSSALEKDPTLVVAANNRALINIRMQRFGDAEADCDMVSLSCFLCCCC